MIVSHFSGIQSLSLRIFKFILVCLSVCLCLINVEEKDVRKEPKILQATHIRFMAGGNWKMLAEKMLTLNIFLKVYQILRTIKMATFKFKTRIVYRKYKTTLKPRTFKIKYIFSGKM